MRYEKKKNQHTRCNALGNVCWGIWHSGICVDTFSTGTTNTKVTAHEPHISEVLDQQLCLLKASKEKRFQNQLYVYIRIDYEP